MSFAVTRTPLRSGSRVQAAQGSTPPPSEKGVLVRSRAHSCGRVLGSKTVRVRPHPPSFRPGLYALRGWLGVSVFRLPLIGGETKDVTNTLFRLSSRETKKDERRFFPWRCQGTPTKAVKVCVRAVLGVSPGGLMPPRRRPWTFSYWPPRKGRRRHWATVCQCPTRKRA